MDNDSRLVLAATMPMRFSGLVVESTNRCNAKCGMCYQSSGPKGSDVLGQSRLQTSVIERCIEEAIVIPSMTPRFHLAGGEAFMHMDECLALFSTAVRAGYLDITGTTNAFWAISPHQAKKQVARLRDAGLTSLEISWDYWHQPFISTSAIANCLIACRDHGIETNLRILTTKSHDLDETLAEIPDAALSTATRITSGPVFATGRASRTIDVDDIHGQTGDYHGACHGSLNLTVNAFGNVFPCCAGFDQTRNYLFGNINSESIVVIADRINSDPIARTVVFRGVAALLPILECAGIAPQGDVKNLCQLCWKIFSSEAAVNALKAHAGAARERAAERLAALILEDADA